MAGTAGALTKVGIGKETTWGTAVVPTQLIPVTSLDENLAEPRIMDSGMRGQLNGTTFGTYLSTRYAEVTMQGLFFPGAATEPACGHLLMALFGTDTIAGTGPYTHTYSVAASTYSLPSYTITVYSGNDSTNAQTYTGARLVSLKLNYAPNAPLTYEAKWVAKSPTAVAAPTLTAPSSNVLLGYQTALTIAGSSNTLYESFSVTFTRGTKPEFTLSNSRDLTDVIFDSIDATWQATCLFDSLTELSRFRSGPAGGIIVAAIGATNPLLTLTASSPSWDTGKPKRSGNDILKLDLSGTFVYNATDGGIAKPVLTNSYATAY